MKTKFYEDASKAIRNKTSTQVKSKCIELESSYKEYKAKLTQSSFGVKETDSESIKEMLKTKCKYFYEMDAIFGNRHNVVPPVLIQPGSIQFNLQMENIVSNENKGDNNPSESAENDEKSNNVISTTSNSF